MPTSDSLVDCWSCLRAWLSGWRGGAT